MPGGAATVAVSVLTVVVVLAGVVTVVVFGVAVTVVVFGGEVTVFVDWVPPPVVEDLEAVDVVAAAALPPSALDPSSLC